jgi:hypothetical protein
VRSARSTSVVLAGSVGRRGFRVVALIFSQAMHPRRIYPTRDATIIIIIALFLRFVLDGGGGSGAQCSRSFLACQLNLHSADSSIF